MRQLLVLGVLLITLGCTSKHEANDMNDHGQHGQHYGHHHGGQAHQQGSQTGAELIVATDPAAPVAGRPVTLRLMIHAADGAMVKDFEVMHEEKVHLVIVRDGLDHFAHIHPAVDVKGNLSVSHTFPAGGKYRLFADYTPAGVDDQPAKVLKAGETFYEPTVCLHRVSKNPSARGKTRVLATVLHPRDAKQIALPEKGAKPKP